MHTSARSIEKIVDEQVRKWQYINQERAQPLASHPVITVSREPGSGGRIIAQKLGEVLGLDVFHQEVIHAMAKSADVSARLLESLDEKGLNVLEEWIASLVDDRHLWPDRYLRHLMKVVVTVGKHGGAVVVGRGANFILPPARRLRLRVCAPRDIRVHRVAEDFKVSRAKAQKRIIRTESDRQAFIRKYFNADIADPSHYDLLINTGELEIGDAVAAAQSVWQRRFGNHLRQAA
jgi:cytidylate kinase